MPIYMFIHSIDMNNQKIQTFDNELMGLIYKYYMNGTTKEELRAQIDEVWNIAFPKNPYNYGQVKNGGSEE